MVMGSSLGRIIVDLGFIGMTCGAISAHMVVCGFTVCEMFGLEHTTARYRMSTLVPANPKGRRDRQDSRPDQQIERLRASQ